MSKKARILIVDDDKNLRKTLTDILGAKDFVPMDVAEGKTALKRVKENSPNIALIDLKLEDMSGLELMEEIKTLSPNTECIMITGHASQASAIEAVNLGAFSFMLKPYNVEQLLVTIQRAVEKQEVLETHKAQYKGIPVPTYTWQWDGEDLVLIDYNNAAEDITHGKIGDFLGIRAREFYKDTPEILEELLRCFNKKTPIQREMLYRYQSTGESKHLAVKYAFTPPNLVLVHTEDITKRVQAEEARRESEEQYRSVVEDSPGMIDRFTPDGTIIFVNQEYCRFFGKKRDDLIGQNIQSTIPDEDRKIVMSRIASLTKESPIQTSENKVIRHDGEIRWSRWTDRALFNDKGQVKSYQSFGEDITKRVQAEEALLESEELYQLLSDATFEAIFLSEKGICFGQNKTAEKMFGYTLDEALGRMGTEWIAPDDRDIVMKNMLSGYELPYQAAALRKDSSTFPCEIQGRMMNYKGKRIRMTALRDITERKRTERLLNTLNRATVAMREALTLKDGFKTVAEELKQLDISCMLFPIDETQKKLFTKYLSFESALLNTVEKLVGIQHEDFSFPIDEVDVYKEVINEKITFFSENTATILLQVLPRFTKKLSSKIIETLRVRKSISAPLMVTDKVIGIFSMQSDTLTREDIPAATAFADQLSSAWNKVELLQNLRKTVDGTIHTIAATVEARDPYTAGHQKRVADLAAAIASEIRLSDQQIEGIRMAGTIHDLGKVQIPAEILSKPGRISDLEYEIIKTHPQVGFDLLKSIDFPWPIAEMVLQHHEKMDGSGYPQGLKGEDILLDARILAVADIVEAMSSHRPYRPALGIEKAFAQIKKEKGPLLDPDVVEACLKVFEQGYELLEG